MRYSAFVVLFLTLIAKTCFAGLSMTISKADKTLVEATIDILESCYKDHSVVGIAGPSVGSITESISSRKTVIPTTLIDETSTVANHSFGPEYSGAEKLQIFIVTITDSNSLVKTLAEVKNTIWWNHMASFLIIDSAVATNECSNAYEMLWESWKMDVLNSNFICLNQTKGTLIYTFNPYASKAPSPWQLENTYKGINDHVWTLFVQKYDNDEPRCDGLNFDKTVDLNGYKIRDITYGFNRWRSVNLIKNEDTNFRMLDVTSWLLYTNLNATWSTSDFPVPDGDEDEIYREAALRSIHRGIKDICLNYDTFGETDLYRYTDPVYRTEIAVITRYQGHMSQLDKLMCVLDINSRFGVLAVLTITLLFSKFWLRKSFISAIMDLFLLISNAALRKIPQETAPRIYLASLFIFVVTIQGIYSGQLASLLTKQVRLPTVDSWEDLARSNHTIYAAFSEADLFVEKPELKKRNIVYWYNNYCPDDAEAACVGDKLLLIDRALHNNWHLSREPISLRYLAYPIRKDWPLQEKINTVIQRLAASGIPNDMQAMALRKKMKHLESYELQGQEPEPKPLTLEHLGFAFKFLAIGLGCATIAFIVEIARFGGVIARSRERVARRIEYIE